MDMKTRRDLLRCYYANGNSPIAAIRAYCTENGNCHHPCNPTTVTKMVQRFEETFSLHDKPREGRRSKEEERSDIVEGAIQDTDGAYGSSSVRKVALVTGIPKTSVHRILRQQLSLFPYKLRLLQDLKTEDHLTRFEFSKWLLDNADMVPNIFWSDEAYLHLDGDISRYHCRIWTSSKPTNFLTKPLHPKKVCVWFGFTSEFHVTPFFFDETVSSQNYLDMLKTHLIPQLTRRRKLSKTVFMQDGAPPHYACIVRQFLYDKFSPQRVISRGCNIVWPPRSPDLNPLDFWFWGALKARVFHTSPPETLEELKARITDECSRFTAEELQSATSSLLTRLQMVLENGGGHIEQCM